MDTSSVQLITVITLAAALAGCTWALLARPLKLYQRASARFALTNLCLVLAILVSQLRTEQTGTFAWVLADSAFLLTVLAYQLAITQLFRRKFRTRLVVSVIGTVLGATVLAAVVPMSKWGLSALIYLLTGACLLSTAITKYRALYHEFTPLVARLFTAPDILLTGLIFVKVMCLLFAPEVVAGYLFTQDYNNTAFLWAFLSVLLLLNITAMATTITRLIMRMKFLAHRDQLTGLLNRRAMSDELDGLWQEHENQQREFCVLMVDVDHFKKINDTHGHHVGDLAIIHLANSLRKHLRKSDICSRFGGEEFLVALPETSLAAAQQVAAKLVINFSQNSWSHTDTSITVSVGIASSTQASSLEMLLIQADRALYSAKSAGRNRAIAYQQDAVYSLTSSSST
ncbi:GGDEF domain-containing protein [Alteromonas sp. ASW11-19]|uniref:diguanylate cyclase n=1 Tax=Alteromonas salexigens TaxID=2982530 RepID=A0ABT2VM75_9ALTE|nr:GGDEF domain-containing protein [Alteromonas salexigens]MCU7554190.1 GGDEF domain-containing protein [Alteromonas salexigens]